MNFHAKVGLIAAALLVICAGGIAKVLSDSDSHQSNRGRSKLERDVPEPARNDVHPAFNRPDVGNPESRKPGIARVFEGGKFGDSITTKSPEFTVNHDWSVKVELKGGFVAVVLLPANVSEDELRPSAWLETGDRNSRKGPIAARNAAGAYHIYDHGRDPKVFTRAFTDGGAFRLYIEGNGVWRATIIQGSGKID